MSRKSLEEIIGTTHIYNNEYDMYSCVIVVNYKSSMLDRPSPKKIKNIIFEIRELKEKAVLRNNVVKVKWYENLINEFNKWYVRYKRPIKQ